MLARARARAEFRSLGWHVDVLRLEPQDVVVLRVGGSIPSERLRTIAEQLQRLFPTQKVAVLNPGDDITVVRVERHDCAAAMTELLAIAGDLTAP